MVWIALGVACFIAFALYVGRWVSVAFWEATKNGDESLVILCCEPYASLDSAPSNSECAPKVRTVAAEDTLRLPIGHALHALKLACGDLRSMEITRQYIAAPISPIESISHRRKCRRRDSEDR
jgi:hypothetical protein